MKDAIFLFYLIGLILLPGCYGKAVDQVVGRVGETVVLSLPSNPTTGYRWQLGGDWPAEGLKLAGNDYQAPPNQMVGSGGEEQWEIIPLKRGTYYLYFVYVRPWEKNTPPAREKHLELKVLGQPRPSTIAVVG